MALTLALVANQCSVPVKQASNDVVKVATVNPSVIKTEKVEVALVSPKKVLKVYPQSVKKRVLLPKEALSNAHIQLTDSSVIKGTEQDTQVNQTVDITTGETQTYVSELPAPWFRVENRGAASLDYGIKRDAKTPVVRLNVRQDVLQLKAIHIGVSGSVYSDGDYFVGVGGEYRW